MSHANGRVYWGWAATGMVASPTGNDRLVSSSRRFRVSWQRILRPCKGIQHHPRALGSYDDFSFLCPLILAFPILFHCLLLDIRARAVAQYILPALEVWALEFPAS